MNSSSIFAEKYIHKLENNTIFVICKFSKKNYKVFYKYNNNFFQKK